MDIWNEIISIVVSNGVFAILFVCLFMYQLKDSAKRETKYQDTIDKLTENLKILQDVQKDVGDIKLYLSGSDDYEELL